MTISELQTKITLRPQERRGTYKFSGKVYLTSGFISEFGDISHQLALTALFKIQQERVKARGGADYFQILEYDGIKFYVIDDVSHITFLLPEEY